MNASNAYLFDHHFHQNFESIGNWGKVMQNHNHCQFSAFKFPQPRLCQTNAKKILTSKGI